MSTKKRPPGFMVYLNDCKWLAFLNAEQKGDLFDALIAYAKDDALLIDKDADAPISLLFKTMVDGIDRDRGIYDKRSKAGEIGAMARWHGHGTQMRPHEFDMANNATACGGMRPHEIASNFDASAIAPDANTNTNTNTNTTSNSTGFVPESAQQGVIMYCQNAGIHLTARHFEEVAEFLAKGATHEVMCYAVDVTIENGAKGWAYARAIIQRWLAAGATTVDAARVEQANFKRKKEEPSLGRMDFDF